MYSSGRDHLAGLADLEIVRDVAGVHGGAAGAHGGTPALSASWSSSWKFSPLPMPLPPEMTMRAAASSGRSDWLSSRFTNRAMSCAATSGPSVTSAEPPGASATANEVAAHRDDLYGVAGAHGGQRVARVDGPDERVLVHDPGDVGDLLDIQHGGPRGASGSCPRFPPARARSRSSRQSQPRRAQGSRQGCQRARARRP